MLLKAVRVLVKAEGGLTLLILLLSRKVLSKFIRFASILYGLNYFVSSSILPGLGRKYLIIEDSFHFVSISLPLLIPHQNVKTIYRYVMSSFLRILHIQYGYDHTMMDLAMTAVIISQLALTLPAVVLMLIWEIKIPIYLLLLNSLRLLWDCHSRLILYLFVVLLKYLNIFSTYTYKWQ